MPPIDRSTWSPKTKRNSMLPRMCAQPACMNIELNSVIQLGALRGEGQLVKEGREVGRDQGDRDDRYRRSWIRGVIGAIRNHSIFLMYGRRRPAGPCRLLLAGGQSQWNQEPKAASVIKTRPPS